MLRIRRDNIRCFDIGRRLRRSDIAMFEEIRPVIADEESADEESRSIEEPGARVPGFQKLILSITMEVN